MTNSIEEITGAKAILVIGSNTTETHPVISYRVREAVRKGAVLIVADPREIDLVEIAHYHLPLRPGTDVALLNGLIHIIIAEDLLDVEFVENRTEGYEKLKESVARYTPAYVSGITGIPESDLRAAARAYATAALHALYMSGFRLDDHARAFREQLAPSPAAPPPAAYQVARSSFVHGR